MAMASKNDPIDPIDRQKLITDAEDAVVAKKVSDQLSDAVINLLIQKPFFGRIIASLKRVDATHWCATAATDGRTLYYNRNFFATMTRDQIKFVLAHEIMHCVYSHVGRRGSRHKEIYNMACDYIVNYVLTKEKIGEMPKFGLYNQKYHDEMTSEELYAILYKEWQDNKITIQVTLDEHLELDEGDDDGEGKGNGQGQGGTVEVDVHGNGKTGKPKLTQEELDQIQNELRAKLIQSAQLCRTGAGDLPAGIQRLINELTTPKMDWRELIDSHIRSTVKDDYTFNRLNKRSFTNLSGLMFPAQDVMETIDIAVAIDTSGSISNDMIIEMLSEVKGIMETFPDFKLRVWSFDTKVYSYKEFTPDTIDEIHEYMPDGGGGTMFECNWEYMREEEIEPEKFIMFTDGYPCGTWGDPDYCDTLFVVHGNDSIEAPFGMTAHYEFTYDK